MELWQPVPVEGYEDYYKVSSKGRVYSVRNDIILKQTLYREGYFAVCLCVNEHRKRRNVHWLVAKAFIQNPNNLPCVNHKDGNKQNNNVENLEWCTYRDNTLHAIRIGLKHQDKGTLKWKCIPVRRIEDGKIFECVADAATECNRTKQSLDSCLRRGPKATCAGYHWERVLPEGEYTERTRDLFMK